MDGTIVMNLAMSLDGYIADEDGGFAWITGQGDASLDTESTLEFEDFLAEIDVVVMGRRCYDQGMHRDYATKEVYVATTREAPTDDSVTFLRENVVETILEARSRGKRVYLFGGGVLIDAFMKANVIDTWIVGIIPVILGKGRPLFFEGSPTTTLHLDEYSLRDGIVIMHYSRRDVT